VVLSISSHEGLKADSTNGSTVFILEVFNMMGSSTKIRLEHYQIRYEISKTYPFLGKKEEQYDKKIGIYALSGNHLFF